MTRYQIDPVRSRIDVTARPSLPGARLVVDEVSGSVDASTEPAGELTVWLQAVIDDDGRAPGLPAWLRSGELVPAEGRFDRVRCDGDRVEVELHLRLADRLIPFTGAGRLERRGDGPAGDRPGAVEAVGVTVVDPRTLGFALPPLVTYTLHTRWRLALVAPEP